MIANSTANTRLCPNCANSINGEAANCPYCKAEVSDRFMPQWLNRDESASEPRHGSVKNKRFSIPGNFMWMAAVPVAAVVGFLAGGYMQHKQLMLSSQAYSKQLQTKDQAIQSQETQLAQTRQQLNESSNQLAELKTKVDESQKELSAARQRLSAATHEVDHLKASRAMAATRVPSPAAPRTASLPAPAAPTRTGGAGVYETTRTTSVYEGPSSAARVVTQINRGTRINVVGSSGDWLEVRSKHGNPPGYVRADDARLIGKTS